MVIPTWLMRRIVMVVMVVASIMLVMRLLAAAAAGLTAPGGLEGQVMGMVSATRQPVLLQGARVQVVGPDGPLETRTGADGRYRFDQLPPGDYDFIATYEGPQAAGTTLRPQERGFSVSPDRDETISVVLLANGVDPPSTPPTGVSTGSGGSNSLLNNPFFWYFLFNRPYAYGYDRPPVVLPPTTQGAPPSIETGGSWSPSGRSYTDYDDGSSVGRGTKQVPDVNSRGATRPGTSSGGGSDRPPILAPSTDSSGSGSRGVTRPGSSTSGGSNSPTIRPPSVPAARPPSSSSPSRPSSSGGSKGVTRPGSSSGPSVSAPSVRPPAVRPPSSGRR